MPDKPIRDVQPGNRAASGWTYISEPGEQPDGTWSVVMRAPGGNRKVIDFPTAHQVADDLHRVTVKLDDGSVYVWVSTDGDSYLDVAAFPLTQPITADTVRAMQDHGRSGFVPMTYARRFFRQLGGPGGLAEKDNPVVEYHDPD